MIAYPSNPKPQKQRWTAHDAPDRVGDCWRTAIAILLGLDRDSVPHFVAEHGEGWWKATTRYLAESGWDIEYVSTWELLTGRDKLPDHGYFLLTILTERSTEHLTSDEPWAKFYREVQGERFIHHTVVAKYDLSEVHDPSPFVNDLGLDYICGAYVVYREAAGE